MNKNFFWKFLRSLANLNFSLIILSLITFSCILGTIIEQDKSLLYYEINYPNYNLLLTFLGINHVFRTWWFILLLTIFIISLLSCTFFTQLPSLKNARRWKFMYNSSFLDDNKYSDTSKYSFLSINDARHSFANIIYGLVRLNFFVFCRNSSIYSYKGLYGRIAPIFVHFSIVTILLGSLFSLFFSFVTQEMIPSSEIFHLKNIVYSGFYSSLIPDPIFRVNNFDINYNLNGSIKQFFSSLSIYSNNQKLLHSKIISVNDPLRFRRMTLYQIDWQINALRINIGKNNVVQKKIVQSSINGTNCWLSSFSLDDQNRILFLLFSLDNTFIICNSTGVVLNKVKLYEKFYINNVPFTICNVMTSTGLQIKIDSGIVLVYLGFFIMMISTSISYISYSQIWIYSSLSYLRLLGSTNRASLFFEQDVSYLRKFYSHYLSCLINQINTKNVILV
uniref:Cytochrome c biogenesis protein CcsB n=1 Tax=Pleurostichidium falkenbergii TaxID=121064 RepID=A0A4D6UWL7_9FLOR|nr:cytochrome c biogenesis protein ccs1 [Pleurostichidium falkenbergii]QCH39589.1 cytochrome c biogenesis protein ccs1 [Pleurostichidium falkenbergii]